METKRPLHVSKLRQPQATINRLQTLIHSTALLALFYYRFSSLGQQYINGGFISFCPWLIISFCELLHSFLWMFGQASRWRPMSRTVYPERLPPDSELPAIDVFICTTDPKKEPTVGVMNTVISAMCLDYPPEKLFVYLSDDGGAPVTLYGMKEAYSFARKWIPFCKEYGIETRAPDAYFSKLDHDEKNGVMSTDFINNRNKMKLRFQEFKKRVETASDAATLSSNPDRHPIIEIIRDDEIEEKQTNMPHLVYVSREKRRSQPHHFKAGALNVLLRVSGIRSNSPYILFLDCDMYCNDPTTAKQAMCFHIDPQISSSLAFVQFPQKFHNLSKNDIYNELLRTGFEVVWLGMDGLRGPFLAGTCLYMKREALFTNPTQKDLNLIANTHYVGGSNKFIASLHPDQKFEAVDSSEDASNRWLEEARLLASCTYENNTEWGEQIGFLYHTVVEDYKTGLTMHCKGWKSVYYHSSRPAFLGSVATNLNDSLIQTTRWNSGLLEVALSRFCPLTYGSSRMSILQSMIYASYGFESFSALPILCYAIIPQLCLLNGIPLYPKVSNPLFGIFTVVYISWHFQHVFEVLSTGGTIKLYWNHLRIMLIKSVTAYPVACLDIGRKFIGMKEISFAVTSKVVDEEQDQMYNRDMIDFQVETRLLLPLTLIVSLNVASLLLGLRRAYIQKTYEDMMFGQIFLSLFIVIINYPIIEGMIIRKDKGRIPTSVTIISGAFLFSVISYVIF